MADHEAGERLALDSNIEKAERNIMMLREAAEGTPPGHASKVALKQAEERLADLMKHATRRIPPARLRGLGLRQNHPGACGGTQSFIAAADAPAGHDPAQAHRLGSRVGFAVLVFPHELGRLEPLDQSVEASRASVLASV